LRVGALEVVLRLLHLRGVRIVRKVARVGEPAVRSLIASPYLLLTGRIGIWLRKGGGGGGKCTALFRGEVVLVLEIEVEM